MTPQLQQAIKLLQMSNLDLAAYLDQELETNPLLERAEPGREDQVTPADGSHDDGPLAEGGAQDALLAAEENRLPPAQEAPLDSDYENLYTNDSPGDAAHREGGGYAFGHIDGRGGSFAYQDHGYDLEQTLSFAVTRRDHLFRQLNVDLDDAVDRLIGAHLIDMLDEAGYITGGLETVAETMGCEVARVEGTLSRLQGFDPTGIFARSLSECLGLQLEEKGRLDPAMRIFLDNLDLVARGDREALMRVCGLDAEDIEQMTAEIKALNPKPGLGFNDEVVQTVVPDVFVREHPQGGWRVELNNDTLPRLLVNARYCAGISGQANTKEDRRYIAEHLNSANWLLKSLDQRANTILSVSTELVRQQEGFFAHGVEHLRPLTLKHIATAVDLHESTVSRVTSNKYMSTPRGTFELKYFFTSAIASTRGEEPHSAEAVRHRIKLLIQEETTDGVLSDDGMAERLAGEGIDIARRTVAKYREAMRIPSSSRRRMLKGRGV